MFVQRFLCWSRRGCCECIHTNYSQTPICPALIGFTCFGEGQHTLWEWWACFIHLIQRLLLKVKHSKGLMNNSICHLSNSSTLTDAIYMITPQEHITCRQINYELCGKERQVCDDPQGNLGERVQHEVILTNETQWCKHDHKSVQQCSCLFSTCIMWIQERRRLPFRGGVNLVLFIIL